MTHFRMGSGRCLVSSLSFKSRLMSRSLKIDLQDCSSLKLTFYFYFSYLINLLLCWKFSWSVSVLHTRLWQKAFISSTLSSNSLSIQSTLSDWVGSRVKGSDPVPYLSGGVLSAPPRGSGCSPDPQRFSTIFSTQDGLSWHYNMWTIMQPLGGDPRAPPLHTPVWTPQFWSVSKVKSFSGLNVLRTTFQRTNPRFAFPSAKIA